MFRDIKDICGSTTGNNGLSRDSKQRKIGAQNCTLKGRFEKKRVWMSENQGLPKIRCRLILFRSGKMLR